VTDTPQSGQGGTGENTDGVGITTTHPVENAGGKHADGVGITRANGAEESTSKTDD